MSNETSSVINIHPLEKWTVALSPTLLEKVPPGTRVTYVIGELQGNIDKLAEAHRQWAIREDKKRWLEECEKREYEERKAAFTGWLNLAPPAPVIAPEDDWNG